MENERINLFEELFRSETLISMNGADLLSLASKFLKIEGSYRDRHSHNLLRKKIAILAPYTTHQLVNIMRLLLYKHGIAPDFFEGGYNGMAAELMKETSDLFYFKPDVLLLFASHDDMGDYPALFSSKDDIDAWISIKLKYYQKLWEMSSRLENCQVFQTLFVVPIYRQLGNLEANYLFSPSSCLRLLNMEMIRQKPPNVTFIDMDYLASMFGKDRWFDDANYFLSKQGFSLDAAGLVSYTIARLLLANFGKIKKCLAIDLDNTIWGGIIGDDGLEGINLNSNDALGESFIFFQRYLRRLRERGVLLAVCSKNDENTAKAPFTEHPDMHLRLDDIACFIANWKDKATNLKEIANQLNIGTDSIVFFDDNPAERELARQFIPEVEVIEVPEDPALYCRALEKSMAFEWAQLSKEDITRTDSYIVARKSRELQSQFVDYDSFLQSLKMKSTVGHVGTMELQRFVQLINKSNQFNLRTRRYSEASLEQVRLNRDEWDMIYLTLTDKFTNYGIISAIIVQRMDKTAFIDTWVMSCRVLKRGVESAAINAIYSTAKDWGCEWVVGEYLSTKKNGMVSGLFAELGFEECKAGWFTSAAPGGSVYRIKLSQAPYMEHLIEIL